MKTIISLIACFSIAGAVHAGCSGCSGDHGHKHVKKTASASVVVKAAECTAMDKASCTKECAAFKASSVIGKDLIAKLELSDKQVSKIDATYCAKAQTCSKTRATESAKLAGTLSKEQITAIELALASVE